MGELESGPQRGGIGSVTELATTKQEYKKVDHFTTRYRVTTIAQTVEKALFINLNLTKSQN